MPRTEEANQRIREAQRERILEAAWKVFAQKGRAVTMADVAMAANVSYGLAYHYFTSKEALFRALVKQTLQSSDAAFRRFGEVQGTPGGRLESLISQLIEARRERPELFQLFYQVLSDEATPPDLHELAVRHDQASQHLLRRLIVEGQAAGEIAAGDPDQLVTAIQTSLDGLIRLAVIKPERFQRYFPDAKIILRMLKPCQDQDQDRNNQRKE
ncbi:MAG TPA: TetR/AcrR family transcriptional regulator [Candidatus Acidoferrales bacterium]|nr:TetR/AcrR family transcriptional regulator [Candidatus Acidoferrales bacterium]